MDQFGIEKALSALGIKAENLGSSTGQTWLKSSGEWINSYSQQMAS